MTDRMTARVVGVLFIVATATAIIGGYLVLPVEDPAALGDLAGQRARIVSGVLLEFVLVASVVGIAAVAFPVLRRRDEGLALTYLGARTVEGALLLAAAMSALVVLGLSDQYGTVAGSGLRPLGDLLVAAREWTYLVGSMVALGVSAVILYSLLYRAALVPSWLSVWGLVGGVLILARAVVELYGIELSAVAQAVLAAPIALNEMVLAVWLIARGFAAPTDTSRPPRTEVGTPA